MLKILRLVLQLLLACVIESRILHIYQFTEPKDTLASFSCGQCVEYKLESSTNSTEALELLHLDPRTGRLRLASLPNCGSFINNKGLFQLKARTSKEANFKTLETLRIKYHGEKCFVKFRRKLDYHTVVSRAANVGFRVFQLRDLFSKHIADINPSDLRIMNEKGKKFYRVDSKTGHLVLRKSLVGHPERIMFVVAQLSQSSKNSKRKKSARLRLFIDDGKQIKNNRRRVRKRAPTNNPPQFSRLQEDASVSEDAEVGTVVATVSASDPDSGSNGMIRYSMSPSQNLMSATYFSIDQITGVITTKRGLDREFLDRHFFRVKAEDGGEPSLEGYMDLTINVLDVNDNGPIFERNIYAADIPEDKSIGDFVLAVRASDADSGSNGEVKYCILNSDGDNSAFSIGEVSGAVTVMKKLDREKVPTYTLQVQAQDQGNPPRSATVTVKITLLDVNDCTPQFSKKVYSATIREDVPVNQLVTTVRATDCDQGSNGEVFFEIVSGNDMNFFSINRINGEVRVKQKLDYEMIGVFNLLVTAQDKGQPFLYNQTTVDIALIDVNDNAPQFVSSHFQTMIPENYAVGQEFYRVQAYDKDHGTNGEITFSFMQNDLPFSINENTGGISIKEELDREKVPKFTFGIKARDKGVPFKEGTAQITITLLDINDNPPKFSQEEYHTSIAENSRWGTSVLQVKAIDPDSGPTNVVYSIVSSSGHDRCFRINPQGLITLSCTLNYNTKHVYVFSVSASDGMLSSTALVYVNVTDSNTHAPEFKRRSYSAEVKEDASLGTSVLTVLATDRDTGSNAKISYSIATLVPEFSVDETTGVIKTAGSLDREKVDTYRFEVTATDHGIPQLKAKSFVYIHIADVNDNDPVFLKPSYEAKVREDIRPGGRVIEVSASDADIGKNTQIIYSFASNGDGQGTFTIDSTQGIIRTLKPLDRETIPEYELTVVATDQGTPPGQASVKVKVILEDVKDSPPLFEKPLYEVTVPEDTPPRSPVITVKAKSQDLSPETGMMYSIVRGNSPQVFDINPNTGAIQTLMKLDYETQSEYRLTVRATLSPFFTETTVMVYLKDINDNTPVLEAFHMNINVQEGKVPPEARYKIPAYDPDVSDKLTFKVMEGNAKEWVTLNATSGELSVNKKLIQASKPANIKIAVTDGLRTASATGSIMMTSVTTEMIQQSIQLEIDDMEVLEFFNTAYEKLRESVSQIVKCKPDQVLMFDITSRVILPVSSADYSKTRLTIWLVLRKKNEKEAFVGYFDASFVRYVIYLHREQIAKEVGINLMAFPDDVCSKKPCNYLKPNSYYDCNTYTYFSGEPQVLSSLKVVFRTVPVDMKFNCSCPADYRGQDCDTHLNLCYSNPCGNHGECVSVEQGFYCRCKADRVGSRCEANVTRDFCPLKPRELPKVNQMKWNPCMNGAQCIDQPGGGFGCLCEDPNKADTPFCELTTLSFRDGDYAAFTALSQKWRLHISLQFTTLQSDALLLYNGQFNDKQDFIAIELSGGQVRFTVSTGGTPASATSRVDGGLNDGRWHSLTAVYKNKTAIVIIDDCKLAVAVQFGTQEGSYGCAAAKRLNQQAARSLQLTSPLMLGGLHSLRSEYPITSKRYTGCLRNVSIDHKRLDLAAPIWKRGTSPKCSIKVDFCRNSPCKRGNCTNTWGTYLCRCPENYGGKQCDKEMKSTMRFIGQSILIKNYRTTSIKLPWSQSLMFRTRKSLGILIETRFRSSAGVLKVVNGRLSYQFNQQLTVNLTQLRVDDGAWHHVDVTWLRGMVRVTGDYIYQATATHQGEKLEFTSELIMGGRQSLNTSAPQPKAYIEEGFVGCMMGITVDGSQIDTSQATKQSVFTGCSMPSHCQSSPCLGGGTCVEGWDTFSCRCRPGYVGKRCTNVCDLKPCQNGNCELSSATPKGYKCKCPPQYTGEYCETRKETPCQDKFFSASNIGLCGPCNCPVGANFNPVCNKTTGECYCNPYHYRSHKGNECLKCNCEEIGSLSLQCRVSDGQCPCIKGSSTGARVIGRRCDRCEDHQSEITAGKGCVVINTSCPRSIAEDIWWKRGAFDKIAEQKCPFGASGTARRICDKNKGWQKPDLMDCVSNSFLNLRKKLKRLEEGKLLWSPSIAMDLARQLDLAITLATRLYPNDIDIALKAITVLFDYESQQNESTLVSAKNHEFAQILVQSASMLFNAENKNVWSVVQRNSAGTADLMEKMENFSGTLANNLAHLKRARYRRNVESIIPPYTVITPNILMELHPVTIRNFNGMQFPPSPDSFESYSWQWAEVTNKVKLPRALFLSPGHKVLERNAAVGYMIIRNIGDLLPKSFDARIRDSKYNVDVNSDVVSVKMPGMEDVQLAEPIHITFYNRQVNRSEYLCVFWNYSVPNTRGGGWSTNGCRRIAINWTHTTCACNHMTSFAVLSDLNLEFPPQVAFAMRIGTYIGIAVSVAILLIAFVSFVCLRGLKKSNANDIHKNLVAAIVIAEIIFLAGINRTNDTTACRLVAILLHYFFSTVFTWMLVEGVHMYRRLSEKRNVDTGRMNFYYFLGWGCPAIVVGISAGLSTEGYGNNHFCWMATDGTLIWTFTIPVMIVVAINGLVFVMAMCASLQQSKRKRRKRRSYSPHGVDDQSSLKAGMRASAVVLPLLGVSLVFAILMVNKDMEMFHYLFAALTAFQGLFIFLFYCLFDKKVRKEYKNAYIRWKTGDKSYGIPKPAPHFKRSYHPSEMQALRSPYHYDDDDQANTSTSTTDHTSSLRSSTIGTSRPTSEAFSTTTAATGTIPDSSATSATEGLSDAETEEFIKKPPKAKYYPGNPELELARKMWDTPDKSELSTTQPETSSDEEETRAPSPVILSESSDSSGDEQTPNGEEKTPKSKKRPKGAPFYASDGPMHSTPMDTTPEVELEKNFHDSDSSDTEEEDKMVPVKNRKDGPTFKVIPEIIADEKGPAGSGSAATPSTTSDTPPIELQLQKKPLKSALKKPKPGMFTPIVLPPDTPKDEETAELMPDKPAESRHRFTRGRDLMRGPPMNAYYSTHTDTDSTCYSNALSAERKSRTGRSGEKKKKKKHKQSRSSSREGSSGTRRFVKFKGDRNSIQLSEPSEFI
ncbi:cadherin EGF LAG seven-pass G-type receptor 2 isoform X2 [Nematostella vectensis]|uniref:cadherin EGF LAG seven-pass G-type receptor 2 isoform X2 n=1 Tax=Nematostella vectensis TaxID=45351 RepID=UPI0020770A6E|nr:cadherin EGF LAG seven-pass G-type receptor 2 isoform X2 [Nematostella vectensis]